ncbi:hypothetical protein [Dyella choica]|uniref:Uncharacterized protein n=1 Tax=Dyella choica TaxID=1927959 RepID=A0A432M4U2_9GAMM|nr:hypothetical protein [Dyella choica]RUL74813.1 hypothetical protein EKH80_12005 [Dyella choica]
MRVITFNIFQIDKNVLQNTFISLNNRKKNIKTKEYIMRTKCFLKLSTTGTMALISMNLLSTHSAIANDWSSFHINANGCKTLYAYIDGKWTEQPTNYMNSTTSRNYWCIYNNAPIRVMAADWNVTYYFGALGSILRADSYFITNNGDEYGIGYWSGYYYDYWNLADAWNVNNTLSKDGFHLLIDKNQQDGSYAFSYDKSWAGINLRASTYMLGGTYHDAPAIYFQVTGNGNASSQEMIEQPGIYLPVNNSAQPSKI